MNTHDLAKRIRCSAAGLHAVLLAASFCGPAAAQVPTPDPAVQQVPTPALKKGPVAAHVSIADPNKGLDLRIDDVEMENTEWTPHTKNQVKAGKTIGIACVWSVHLVKQLKYWKTAADQHFQYVMRVDGGTIAIGTFTVPAGTQLGSKTSKSGGWKTPSLGDPSPYSAPSSTTVNEPRQLEGKTSTTHWTAQKEGKHQVSCEIAPTHGFIEPTQANNHRSEPLQVYQAPVSASTAAAAAVARPQPYTGPLSPSNVARARDQQAPVTFDPNRGTNLPAVQRPPVPMEVGRPVPGPKVSTPAPNGSALGAAPAGRLSAVPPLNLDSTRIASANVQQDLGRATCAAVSGLRFSCATQAGFDRCESLRMRRQVEACRLEPRR